MCRNARDKPSAPTMDWQRQGAVSTPAGARAADRGENSRALGLVAGPVREKLMQLLEHNAQQPPGIPVLTSDSNKCRV